MEKYRKVGVLGGMGPLATVIFYRKVIELTEAKNDQDNIDMVIINDTKIPDRTNYLLYKNTESPAIFLKKDIDYLEQSKCDIIVMPCNTAHYFYDELSNYAKVPIINMIDLVFKKCVKRNYKKVALFATKGTIFSGVYNMYNNQQIEFIIPDDEHQAIVDSLIYDYVKKNRKVEKDKFESLINFFYNKGAEGIILGCTELSVIIDELNLDDNRILDSTCILAEEIVSKCK